jgi:hypothetical protein
MASCCEVGLPPGVQQGVKYCGSYMRAATTAGERLSVSDVLLQVAGVGPGELTVCVPASLLKVLAAEGPDDAARRKVGLQDVERDPFRVGRVWPVGINADGQAGDPVDVVRMRPPRVVLGDRSRDVERHMQRVQVTVGRACLAVRALDLLTQAAILARRRRGWLGRMARCRRRRLSRGRGGRGPARRDGRVGQLGGGQLLLERPDARTQALKQAERRVNTFASQGG